MTLVELNQPIHVFLDFPAEKISNYNHKLLLIKWIVAFFTQFSLYLLFVNVPQENGWSVVTQQQRDWIQESIYFIKYNDWDKIVLNWSDKCLQSEVASFV